MPLIGTVSSTQAIYGSSDPTDDVGADGDIYVQSVNNVVVGIWKKESGQWNLIGNVNPGWIDYTPTVTASSGTITTVLTKLLRYKYLTMNTIMMIGFVYVSVNGTGAVQIVITTPWNLAFGTSTNWPMYGFSDRGPLWGLMQASDNKIYLTHYDGTYPISGGAGGLTFSATFEIE